MKYFVHYTSPKLVGIHGFGFILFYFLAVPFSIFMFVAAFIFRQNLFFFSFFFHLVCLLLLRIFVFFFLYWLLMQLFIRNSKAISTAPLTFTSFAKSYFFPFIQNEHFQISWNVDAIAVFLLRHTFTTMLLTVLMTSKATHTHTSKAKSI